MCVEGHGGVHRWLLSAGADCLASTFLAGPRDPWLELHTWYPRGVCSCRPRPNYRFGNTEVEVRWVCRERFGPPRPILFFAAHDGMVGAPDPLLGLRRSGGLPPPRRVVAKQ